VLRFRDDGRFRAGCAAASLAAAPRYSRESKAREMIEVIERVANGRGKTAAVEAAEGPGGSRTGTYLRSANLRQRENPWDKDGYSRERKPGG
jgi:hypothetical protein